MLINKWRRSICRAQDELSSGLKHCGLIEKIEPTRTPCRTAIGPARLSSRYLTDQWYVDAKTLAQPAIEAVREGATTFVPAAMGSDVLQLDGKHPALVHLPANLVGASNSVLGTVAGNGKGLTGRRTV